MQKTDSKDLLNRIEKTIKKLSKTNHLKEKDFVENQRTKKSKIKQLEKE